jgi:hypothetical protein
MMPHSAVAIWINRSAIAECRRYITRRDVRLPVSEMQELAEHYQQRGSWKGVERSI